MRTFMLTLSDESDPRSPKHFVLAGPTHDYPTLRNTFHAKNSDTEFATINLWDSTGGIIRKKRLVKEVASEKAKPSGKKIKVEASEA